MVGQMLIGLETPSFVSPPLGMFSYLVGGQYHGKVKSKQRLLSHQLNLSIYLLLELQKKPCGFVNDSMI
jgi:hypothetical protein